MKHFRTVLGVLPMFAIAACGGGGVTSAPPPISAPAPAPAPSPTPSPTPTPTPTPAVAGKLFATPPTDQALAVVAEGWQFDYTANVGRPTNVVEEDGFSARYDPVSGNYNVTLPISGSGTLYRLDPIGQRLYGPGFAGAAADSVAQATGQGGSMEVYPGGEPGSRYSYVSFGSYYADVAVAGDQRRTAYGAFGVAQPTRPGDVPVTGTARYNGTVVGGFAGDAFGSWVAGTSKFDFDFGAAALSGDMTLTMQCFMGCSYDNVIYTLARTQFTRGSTTFSGSLTSPGAPGDGTFSGLFAGPGAAEMMARFDLPFFNPEYGRWMPTAGVIVGKR